MSYCSNGPDPPPTPALLNRMRTGPNARALPRAKKLAKGAYRLTLTATDSLGNQASYTTRFRIK